MSSRGGGERKASAAKPHLESNNRRQHQRKYQAASYQRWRHLKWHQRNENDGIVAKASNQQQAVENERRKL